MARGTKTYRIQQDGFKIYFTLHVSKTQKAMHNEIVRCGNDDQGLDGVAGQFSPVSCHIDENGERVWNLGDMFLNEQYLQAGITSHECLHAAMAYERFIRGFYMDYNSEDCNPDEERFSSYINVDNGEG